MDVGGRGLEGDEGSDIRVLGTTDGVNARVQLFGTRLVHRDRQVGGGGREGKVVMEGGMGEH